MFSAPDLTNALMAEYNQILTAMQMLQESEDKLHINILDFKTRDINQFNIQNQNVTFIVI